MADIDIEVWDATGNKRVVVQVPDDVALERILVVLVDRLGLPKRSPDGQPMSYKLHHRRAGLQLLEERTLAEQDVRHGDVLRIQPEITAGAGSTRTSTSRREGGPQIAAEAGRSPRARSEGGR